MTTKMTGLRIPLAQCASGLWGGTCPLEDLAMPDQYPSGVNYKMVMVREKNSRCALLLSGYVSFAL